MKKLNENELIQALAELPNWTKKEDVLHCQIKCANFKEAFALMTRIAFEAEKQNHHPDWSNSYNTITIELTTYDAGGLTEKDVKLAKSIQEIITKN